MRISDWSSDVCSSDLGDLQGGLRNLWDFHCLVGDFLRDDPQFHLTLMEEAHHHGLWAVVLRALRLSNRFYGPKLIEYDAPFRLRYTPERDDDLRSDTAREGKGRCRKWRYRGSAYY